MIIIVKNPAIFFSLLSPLSVEKGLSLSLRPSVQTHTRAHCTHKRHLSLLSPLSLIEGFTSRYLENSRFRCLTFLPVFLFHHSLARITP